MERRQGELTGPQAEAFPGTGRAGPFEVRQERVNHHVADEHDSLGIDSRTREIGDARRLRDEEPVGQGVGDDAVQLLGHRAVETPQSRFNMREGQAEFRRHERRRHGRRHVADHDNPIRAQIEQHRLQSPQDFGRLRNGAPRADSQVGDRRRNLQLAEKGLAHPLVVVLPGVHDGRRRAARRQGPRDGRHLHEIRPSTGDETDESHSVPSMLRGSTQWARER